MRNELIRKLVYWLQFLPFVTFLCFIDWANWGNITMTEQGYDGLVYAFTYGGLAAVIVMLMQLVYRVHPHPFVSAFNLMIVVGGLGYVLDQNMAVYGNEITQYFIALFFIGLFDTICVSQGFMTFDSKLLRKEVLIGSYLMLGLTAVCILASATTYVFWGPLILLLATYYFLPRSIKAFCQALQALK